MSTIKISNFENAIYNKSQNARSAWDRGVAKYALDIISDLKERGINEVTPESPLFLKQCLNGAASWQQYSNGGCSLISDYDIVTRLGTQNERYKFHYGNLERPNARESWLDCQARALLQAFRLLRSVAIVAALQPQSPFALDLNPAAARPPSLNWNFMGYRSFVELLVWW